MILSGRQVPSAAGSRGLLSLIAFPLWSHPMAALTKKADFDIALGFGSSGLSYLVSAMFPEAVHKPIY